MSEIFFTSDTHYGHTNIIKYCRRPFVLDPGVQPDPWIDGNLDTERMDETMIENWNGVVQPADTVYHLGDVMFGNDLQRRLSELRRRLNGRIVLVLGNHDRANRGAYLKAGFDEVHRILLLKELGPLRAHHNYIALRHKPPEADWDDTSYELFLCGHVHEKWRSHQRVVNVGVDVWNFTPVHVTTLNTLVYLLR